MNRLRIRWFWFTLAAFAFTGCQSSVHLRVSPKVFHTDPRSPQAIRLTNVVIVLASKQQIKFMYDKHLAQRNAQSTNGAAGFQIGNYVWVPWTELNDERGDPLPNFYVFGHEIWHLVKGDFHPLTTARNVRTNVNVNVNVKASSTH